MSPKALHHEQLEPRRSRLRNMAAGFVLAVASVALAHGLTDLLWERLYPNISPLYLAAVMISALYGGFAPGLVATVLAGALSEWLLWTRNEDPTGLGDLLRIFVFLAAAVLVSGLGVSRRRVREQLRQSHDRLEQQVEQRTRDLDQANRRLKAEAEQKSRSQQLLQRQAEQLRAMTSEMSLIEERERRQLAMRLHDDVGQALAMAKLGLTSACERRLEEDAREKLGQVQRLIEQAIHSTRSLTSQLSPPVLYEIGFTAALRWLVEQIAAEHRLDGGFRTDREQHEVQHEVAVLLFTAVRELLVNVVKHSGARRFEVEVAQEGAMLRISVADDGCGFGSEGDEEAASQQRGHHFGMFSIRERLEHLGGRLEVQHPREGGARVVLHAPTILGNRTSQEQ